MEMGSLVNKSPKPPLLPSQPFYCVIDFLLGLTISIRPGLGAVL